MSQSKNQQKFCFYYCANCDTSNFLLEQQNCQSCNQGTIEVYSQVFKIIPQTPQNQLKIIEKTL